ncbi:VPS4-associated protein 1 [Umbelopsis sp. PMI_123]|nr:VPS4-associated protein 1 [Umbelopsis sp. PMI_123]
MKNHYILRATTTERPCFVCSKFSSVVLTSADNSNEDWFYICKSHLNDSNFCSRHGGSSPRPASPAASPSKKPVIKDADAKPESNSVSDLISGIGTGIWNTWKGNPKSDDEQAKEKDKQKEESKTINSTKQDSPTPPPPAASTTPPPKPTPVTYILHRDFYYLREREAQKRKAKKDASARLQNMQFPEVPKTIPGSLSKPN